MNSSDIILSIQGISKKYERSSEFGMSDFWALKNINFTVKKGEVIGIIGNNGAGKSTLLKILSEIISPTSGSVQHSGKLLSILDLGTGFHSDLSGYENIFFNASLIGMKQKEIKEKIKYIIDFSGLEKYIHEPIKKYSNGMYLRLALSIALYSSSDILLLDEIIAAGDAEFKHKALNRINHLVKNGLSCILISHDLNTISSMCNKTILLEQGEIEKIGNTQRVIEQYNEKVIINTKSKTEQVLDCDACRFISIHTTKTRFKISESATIVIQFEKKTVEEIDIVLEIKNLHGKILTDCPIYREDYNPVKSAKGIYETICTIPPNLFNTGVFTIDVLFGDKESSLIRVNDAARLVYELPEWEQNKKWNKSSDIIPIRPRFDWKSFQKK